MRHPITTPKKPIKTVSIPVSINHKSTSEPVNADHLVKEQMSSQSLLRSGRSVPSVALTIVVVLATIRVGIVVRTIPGVRQSMSRHGVLAMEDLLVRVVIGVLVRGTGTIVTGAIVVTLDREKGRTSQR
jgi:hypothetical protein